MPIEKIMHRDGRILGTEILFCPICRRYTYHTVVFFYPSKYLKTMSQILMSFSIPLIFFIIADIVRAIKMRGYNVYVPDHSFIGYVCNVCKSLSIPKNQSELKKKYGYKLSWLLTEEQKQDIEFRIWKF